MKASKVVQLIKSLGENYSSLVAHGLIPDSPLEEIYKGRDHLHFSLEPGVGLSFDAETSFKKLFITLMKSTPSTRVYAGELPAPFSAQMTQGTVRTDLGQPDASRGPTKMPAPLGETGGWDTYRLDERTNKNARVTMQYTKDLIVDALTFSVDD